MNIFEIMDAARRLDGSDIHLAADMSPVIRISGVMKTIDSGTITPDSIKSIIREIVSDKQWEKLEKTGDIDLAFEDRERRRYRVNVFRQRGSYSMVMRLINTQIPDADDLMLPEAIKKLAEKKRGLILVTGPTGSGKSTTLAAMLDKINTEKSCHILTMEDPIEYIHRNKKSIVNQREIGSDSLTYANALRASLREDPDVILVGEMRDMETISMALTAAETGHLVMSTLHTVGAVKTIDRIIDVFPPHQQQQVRMQLSTILQGVVSQQLIPRKDGNGRMAAFEIMLGVPAIANLIREAKTFQILSVIQTGSNLGMVTMDSYIAGLLRKNLISMENALNFAIDKDNITRMLNNTK